MAKLIALVYVGNKRTAYDNIARSGVTWNGKGDVQEVTDAQAKLLLKFEDQWQLANAEDKAVVESPVSITVIDEDGDSISVDPDVFNKPLERMSKAELKAYAQDKWGKELDARKSSKALIDQIEEWERDLDVTIGVAEE
ncbi:hypothetical protein UFOVP653_63 [uncultured Caudovirales phage]|uniref:Uncharacterized protein n=1 Tax=uncultured Caudovirales phage TaxID=2100421 RepID=A0A6J5N674_9CAUD|nr:hypothetical protein UFOVP653_63 [uncultured Caudovirales phage]